MLAPKKPIAVTTTAAIVNTAATPRCFGASGVKKVAIRPPKATEKPTRHHSLLTCGPSLCMVSSTFANERTTGPTKAVLCFLFWCSPGSNSLKRLTNRIVITCLERPEKNYSIAVGQKYGVWWTILRTGAGAQCVCGYCDPISLMPNLMATGSEKNYFVTVADINLVVPFPRVHKAARRYQTNNPTMVRSPTAINIAGLRA